MLIIGKNPLQMNLISKILVKNFHIVFFLNKYLFNQGGIFVMLIIGLSFSFIVTSLEFYFKAKRRRLLDGVKSFVCFFLNESISSF